MRLHHLQLQAFLAFPGEERVDFDRLNDAGLFLLTGRTGAGKTAILDAVCFALYGQVTGSRGIKRLRSDHAPATLPTEVTLELTLRSRRLRVRRRPEQERPAKRGTGMTTGRAEVELWAIEPDGTASLLGNRYEEVGQELQDALGMTRDQFCQVVLLPQGGFQKFLHSPTKDREPLLRELFDVQRFGDIERWLEHQRMQAGRDAEGSARRLREIVSSAEHVVRSAGEHDEPALAPEHWERDPQTAVTWLAEQAVVAEAQSVTAADVLAEATARRERAEAALTAAQELAGRRTEFQAATAALAEWEATRADHDVAVARLAAARRAAPAHAHVETWRTREKAAEEAGRAAEAAMTRATTAGIRLPARSSAAAEQTAVPDHVSMAADLRTLAAARRQDAGAISALIPVEKAVSQAGQALEALRGRRASLELRIETTEKASAERALGRPTLEAALVAARDASAAVGALQEAADAASARALAAAERDRLALACEAAHEAWMSARVEAVSASEAYLKLQRRHLEGIASVLAARLREGEACEVCGSLEHPAPAQPADGDAVVTEEHLEAAANEAGVREAARDSASDALQALRQEQSAAAGAAGEEPHADLKRAASAAANAAREAAGRAAGADEAASALGALDAADVAAGEALQQARVEHATLTAEIERQTGALEDDLARVDCARAGAPTLAARLEQLAAAADAAEEAAGALEGAARASAEAGSAHEAATQSARAAGFDSPDDLATALLDEDAVAALESRASEWTSTLAARRTAAERPALVAAAAAPEPDLASAASAVREAKSPEGAAHTANESAIRRRGELRQLATRLQEAVDSSAPVFARKALVSDLADLSNGRGAANRLNMSLSIYVLAARLEEVAAAANERLNTMTAGRYALEHVDDTAKGRSLGGLDLRVLDTWTGARREPATLSGGETFMASLALALGLADTVAAQSGGVRLETLFVDEGFGTLDDEGTLDDVLEALDALREGGRTVGLVSHVAELRQRIPTQVRVDKQRDGSTIAAPAAV